MQLLGVWATALSMDPGVTPALPARSLMKSARPFLTPAWPVAAESAAMQLLLGLGPSARATPAGRASAAARVSEMANRLSMVVSPDPVGRMIALSVFASQSW